MAPFLSVVIAILVIIIAVRLALKVTGCLVKIVIFGLALWVILMVLNVSFHFLTSIFSIFT